MMPYIKTAVKVKASKDKEKLLLLWKVQARHIFKCSSWQSRLNMKWSLQAVKSIVFLSFFSEGHHELLFFLFLLCIGWFCFTGSSRSNQIKHSRHLLSWVNCLIHDYAFRWLFIISYENKNIKYCKEKHLRTRPDLTFHWLKQPAAKRHGRHRVEFSREEILFGQPDNSS